MTGDPAASEPITVIIADDHRIVRDGLVTILGAMDGVRVAGAAADIHRAIEAAATGHAMLDSRAAARLVHAASRDARGQDAQGGPLPDGLTEREAQVLALIAQGLSNTEIAATLYVTRSTVKTHINQIFAKTGSRDRPQAIVYAHQHGITAPPERQ